MFTSKYIYICFNIYSTDLLPDLLKDLLLPDLLKDVRLWDLLALDTALVRVLTPLDAMTALLSWLMTRSMSSLLSRPSPPAPSSSALPSEPVIQKVF